MRFFLLSLVVVGVVVAEMAVPKHMRSDPLLQIPCALSVLSEEYESEQAAATPVASFVDTGAEVSVLSYRAAQKAGLIPWLDRRYAGHARGVGQCRVLGRIPAGAVSLRVHNQHEIPAPSLTVLESTNDGVDLLLGLDFLREHQATLKLREGDESMTVLVEGQDVHIPFLRPRTTLSFTQQQQQPKEEDCLRDSRLCEQDSEDDDGCLDMSGI